MSDIKYLNPCFLRVIMKKSIEKKVDKKLNVLHYKEQKLHRKLRKSSPEEISEDIKNFLEYCVEERKNWANKNYEKDEFWAYAFHLGEKIIKWGNKYS